MDTFFHGGELPAQKVGYKGSMEMKKQQLRAKYDRITQLEGRIDYLEGVIYQMFQLIEKLLTRLGNRDSNETTQLYQRGSSDMTDWIRKILSS